MVYGQLGIVHSTALGTDVQRVHKGKLTMSASVVSGLRTRLEIQSSQDFFRK